MPVFKCEKCGKVHQDESQCGFAPVRCPKCGTKALWLDEQNMMTCQNMECDCDKFTAPEWARTANHKPTGAENGGFDLCCGKPPKITEWRPGCYGARERE